MRARAPKVTQGHTSTGCRDAPKLSKLPPIAFFLADGARTLSLVDG